MPLQYTSHIPSQFLNPSPKRDKTKPAAIIINLISWRESKLDCAHPNPFSRLWNERNPSRRGWPTCTMRIFARKQRSLLSQHATCLPLSLSFSFVKVPSKQRGELRLPLALCAFLASASWRDRCFESLFQICTMLCAIDIYCLTNLYIFLERHENGKVKNGRYYYYYAKASGEL